jgi:hypothetical protein
MDAAAERLPCVKLRIGAFEEQLFFNSLYMTMIMCSVPFPNITHAFN